MISVADYHDLFARFVGFSYQLVDPFHEGTSCVYQFDTSGFRILIKLFAFAMGPDDNCISAPCLIQRVYYPSSPGYNIGRNRLVVDE